MKQLKKPKVKDALTDVGNWLTSIWNTYVIPTYNNVINYMQTNETGRVIISTVTTLLPYLTFGAYALFYLSSNSITCYFATGESSSKNMVEVFKVKKDWWDYNKDEY